MTTRLIVARHGNTFAPGVVPTRVGCRTDLPLVASGEAQARRIGKFLRLHQMVPDVVFAAPLKRSLDTARLAVEALGLDLPITSDERFSEIDYGPDENQPESVVVARIGEQALRDWDEHAKGASRLASRPARHHSGLAGLRRQLSPIVLQPGGPGRDQQRDCPLRASPDGRFRGLQSPARHQDRHGRSVLPATARLPVDRRTVEPPADAIRI